MSANKRTAIGVDIGGTNSRAGLVDSDGNILFVKKERGITTGLKRNLKERLEQVRLLVDEVVSFAKEHGYSPVGIGVGIGGQVSTDGWVIGNNGPRDQVFEPTPILDLLKETFSAIDLPVFVENDSKVAAYGEYVFGAGKGLQHMVGMTVGTGLGGGVIVDGKLLHGARGLAGHVGFISVDMHGPLCPSGVVGCAEYYVSGTGIRELGQVAALTTKDNALYTKYNGDASQVTSDDVFEAAIAGDEVAQKVIDDFAYTLAVTITSLVHVLNPEIVTIGGGVGDRSEVFLDKVVKHFKSMAMIQYCSTPIVKAELGDRAGVAGAAAIAGLVK